MASQQGQKIFTITRENYNEVLPQLNLGSDVMTDIRNAINAGKTVTTHEHNINFHGWTSAGYIIIDPNNGAGAYLISGGANGAFMNGAVLGSSIALLALSIDVVIKKGVKNAQILAYLTAIFIPFIAGFIAGTLIIAEWQDWKRKQWGCFISGVLIGFSSVSALGFKYAGNAVGMSGISIALITALGFFFPSILPTAGSFEDCKQ